MKATTMTLPGTNIEVIGRVLKEDIIHPETRQPLARKGQIVSIAILAMLIDHGVDDPAV